MLRNRVFIPKAPPEIITPSFTTPKNEPRPEIPDLSNFLPQNGGQNPSSSPSSSNGAGGGSDSGILYVPPTTQDCNASSTRISQPDYLGSGEAGRACAVRSADSGGLGRCCGNGTEVGAYKSSSGAGGCDFAYCNVTDAGVVKVEKCLNETVRWECFVNKAIVKDKVTSGGVERRVGFVRIVWWGVLIWGLALWLSRLDGGEF